MLNFGGTQFLIGTKNIKEVIKNELNNIERDLRNKIKALIDLENDVKRPIKEAIFQSSFHRVSYLIII